MHVGEGACDAPCELLGINLLSFLFFPLISIGSLFFLPVKSKRGLEEGDGTEFVINCRKVSYDAL